MNTVVGLFLAVVGLFLIWLWSTGRAQVIFQDLWNGAADSGFTAGGGGGFTGAGASGSWGNIGSAIGAGVDPLLVGQTPVGLGGAVGAGADPLGFAATSGAVGVGAGGF